MSHHRWAIVLAAGEGSRIRRFLTDAGGRTLPKQFWPIGGQTTMLDWSLRRAEGVVPVKRLVVVVAERQRNLWEGKLPGIEQENIVVQPENRGTAVGVLLPLLAVVRRDRSAIVLLLPCDHFVEREQVLRSAIERAFIAVGTDPAVPVLLGMTGGAGDREYGWILPGSRPESQHPVPVAAFVEKPSVSEMERLRGKGALINSFILAAAACRLLELCAESLPGVMETLARVDPRPTSVAGQRALAEVYATLPSLDFSRDVVAAHASEFSVVRVPECGWSDIGTPERLMKYRRRSAQPGTRRLSSSSQLTTTVTPTGVVSSPAGSTTRNRPSSATS